VIWWEKHVEYKFVQDSEFDFAAPLSGAAEAALSDLIFGASDKLVLIEFKRNRTAISSEAEKFTKPLEEVAAALEGQPKCHYLMYAESKNDSLSLEGCEYWGRSAVSPKEVLSRGVSLEDFKSYCESLMPYRAPDKRCNSVFSFSGLEQVVGISSGKVKTVTFSEFLARHHPDLGPAAEPAPKRLGP
jgi:hypothetical protein